MKYYIYILFLTTIQFSCSNPTKKANIIAKKEVINQENNIVKIDSIKASKSKAVIKAQLIKFEGGDKYYYSNLKVLKVILNQTKYTIKDTIRVAYYNWSEGIPKNKECTLYLVPWPLGSTELNEKKEWMLLKGDAKYACECK